MKMIKQPTIPPMPKQPVFDARDTQYNLPIGTDCISRQAAIDAVARVTVIKSRGGRGNRIAEAVDSAKIIIADNILHLPPIQPKRGKWIHHPEIGWGETWLCDQCGEKTTSTVMGKPRANFCPNCGAKMEVNNESN